MNVNAILERRSMTFDSELADVQAAIGGDDEALERLLKSSRDRLLRRLERRLALSPYADFSAQDVLQQVFVDVFQKVKTFDLERGSWTTWLNRVADNRLTSTLRARTAKKRGGHFKHSTSTATVDSEESAIQLVAILADKKGLTASKIVSKQEQLHGLQIAIAKLPDDQRTAVQLHLLDGQSLDLTANVMGKTMDAIRGLIHRAKRALRTSLETSTTWFRLD